MTDAKAGHSTEDSSDRYESLRSSLGKYREILDLDNETKNNKINILICELWGKEQPLDPLEHFFYRTFRAQMQTEDVKGYAAKHQEWEELMKVLLDNEIVTKFLSNKLNEEEKFQLELSIVACYRMYRNLNEFYEYIQVTSNSSLDAYWPKISRGVETLENLPVEKLYDKPLSGMWQRIALNDQGATTDAENQKKAIPIFPKLYSEYITLMKNEQSVYKLRTSDEKNDFVWYGESLDRFLSNELAYLCVDLLHRLEKDFDEANYLEQWECFRKSESTADGLSLKFKEYQKRFKEYQKRTNMLTAFLKNIVKLHQGGPEGDKWQPSAQFRKPLFNGDGKLTAEGLRFEVFLEVAYLHAVIACQFDDIKDLKEILKNWPKDDNEDSPRSNRSNLRNPKKPFEKFTKNDVRFQQFLGGKPEGMSYALLCRWLRERSDGFYLALASNVYPGKIVGKPKLKRVKGSSLWGNKIILKHDTNYYQIAQTIDRDYRNYIADILTNANKFFLNADQSDQVGKINKHDLMFGATLFEFANIKGEELQSEWENAFPINMDWNENKAKRLVNAIWNFYTNPKLQPKPEEKIYSANDFPLQNLDNEWKQKLLHSFNIQKNSTIVLRILDCIHGDEWGGNFTIKDGEQLFAIDLEDVLIRGNNGHITFVGGLHAWRFIDGIDKPTSYENNLQIKKDEDNNVDVAFNAYSGMGRLLAALVQKTLKNYYIYTDFGDKNREDFIDNSVKFIWNFIESKCEHNSQLKEHGVPFQIWASFVDWLYYWKVKDNGKLDPKDFKTAFDKILNFAKNSNPTLEE